jgi:hypothetical protein
MNPNQPQRTQPQPDEPEVETHSRNVIHAFFDGVGDTTIRPMRSPVLRQIRPDRPPEPPPAKPSPEPPPAKP